MTRDRQPSPRELAPPDPLSGSRERRASLALLCTLLLGWLALYRASVVDLLSNASTGSLRLNSMVALGLLALVLRRARALPLRPALRRGPLHVVVGCVIVHLGLSRTLDIDLLSCVCMVVGVWGLVGLMLPPARWRQALPLTLAGVCILPMSAALDIYVGFPLRLATAQVVQAVLEPLGSHATAETIVLIEGAGVQIDLPCSGVHSLWSGALLFTAITWIERRRVGLAWVTAGALYAGLLVMLNAARVLALVLLHGYAPAIALDVLHVPLGLGAFATAGLVGWAMLRRLPPAREPPPEPPAPPRARRGLWILSAALLVLAALPVTSPVVAQTPVRPLDLDDPALVPAPLRPDEARLFAHRHAQAAGKWDFDLGEGHGQLAMVQGRSWRSQHRPDICHAAHGRHVDREQPVLLAPGLPARQLWLRGADGDPDAMAFYWFQSATQTTNEHGTRIWAALDGDAEPWMMVSVLVEPPRSPDDPELRALLLRAHAHAHAQLTAAEPTAP